MTPDGEMELDFSLEFISLEQEVVRQHEHSNIYICIYIHMFDSFILCFANENVLFQEAQIYVLYREKPESAWASDLSLASGWGMMDSMGALNRSVCTS